MYNDNHQLVVLNDELFVQSEGYLFAIGGMDENKTVLSSAEKYDPETNTWTSIPAMMQVSLSHAFTKIYQIYSD